MSTIDAARPGSSRLYFGIVRVRVPVASPAIVAIDVATLGAGFDGALFLGWRQNRLVIARPDQCGLVVIVRAKLEADQAARILEAVKGQQPCIADFSGTLPPR